MGIGPGFLHLLSARAVEEILEGVAGPVPLAARKGRVGLQGLGETRKAIAHGDYECERRRDVAYVKCFRMRLLPELATCPPSRANRVGSTSWATGPSRLTGQGRRSAGKKTPGGARTSHRALEVGNAETVRDSSPRRELNARTGENLRKPAKTATASAGPSARPVRPQPDLAEPALVLRCVPQVPRAYALELVPARFGIGVETGEEAGEAQGRDEPKAGAGQMRRTVMARQRPLLPRGRLSFGALPQQVVLQPAPTTANKRPAKCQRASRTRTRSAFSSRVLISALMFELREPLAQDLKHFLLSRLRSVFQMPDTPNQ